MIHIPWHTKIIGKIILSRIPLSYNHWKTLGIFKHGKMQDPSYVLAVFKKHYDRVNFKRKGKGFVALELGPGDSLCSALVARCFGASLTYLVDVENFAKDDLASYHAMTDYLRKLGYNTNNINGVRTFAEMMEKMGANYSTKGLQSLREMPDQSVDFIWSQAVLEHLKLKDFLDIMRELRRILRADGVCSHRIDLKDHLGGALNHLRFSDKLWESNLFVSSGFYTNRIRYSEMLELFESAGFSVTVIAKDKWDRLPTPRPCLADKFRKLPDEELSISGFDVVLKPR